VRINQTKNNTNFKGVYNNKFILSSLEAIADHSASFSAGAMFVGATLIRPLAISATPKAEKDNKKILSAESISSGIVKLIIALGISMPIENAVKNIDKKQISNKENFDFLSQTIKLSSNLISAIPKSILAVAFIPLVADLLTFKRKENKKENKAILNPPTFIEFKNNINFKGKKDSVLTKGIETIINSKQAQDFANNFSSKKDDLARNMTVLTDVLLTCGSVVAIEASKKIENKEKKPLIINKLLSSAISIVFGCSIDKIIKNIGKNIVDNFKNENLSNPKLAKYLDGINVLRPTVIFALVYYALIPIFTTYVSDKMTKIDTAKEEK